MKIRGFQVTVLHARAEGNYTNTYIWTQPRTRYTVELWYDVHTRSWVAQTKDENGYQLLSADYVGTREDGEAAFEARCYAQSDTPVGV